MDNTERTLDLHELNTISLIANSPRCRCERSVCVCVSFVYVFLTDITSLILQRHNAVSQVFKTSKYLAAISIGFLVAVSPWNISTLVVAVTNVKLHEDLDFAVSWLAIGNSFWNVVIYSVLNRKFR